MNMLADLLLDREDSHHMELKLMVGRERPIQWFQMEQLSRINRTSRIQRVDSIILWGRALLAAIKLSYQTFLQLINNDRQVLTSNAVNLLLQLQVPCLNNSNSRWLTT